ncbi:MAG: ABC transporter permease [Bifidobacteriaceae bacterium]|jgi:peptide/nickel transport system permease protein|nr:ABC transporter permease [Bifidobacteriaceae bacterium]
MTPAATLVDDPPPPEATPAAAGHRAGSQFALWRGFLIRRLGGAAANVVLLVLLTFFIVQLIPGDPATAIAGDNATLEQVETVRHELGLDQPILAQLGHYLAGVAHGDFGQSFRYHLPATQIVRNAAPYTLSIAALAVVLVLVLGVGTGVVVGIATRGDRNRWLDRAFTWITSLVQSIPPYLQATLLVLVFAVWLSLFPPAYTLAYGFWESAVLPVAALSIGGIASVARIVRRETGVVQEMDFMRTARGWRLPPLVRYAKHLLPNILTTALTLAGIILTSMLGSALIVETVFAWPGLGSTVIQAIAVDKDYPVIQAAVFFIGFISILITLAIDTVLGIIDPRTLGTGHG